MTGFRWNAQIAAAAVAFGATLLPAAGAEPLTQVYVYVQDETPARSWFPVWFDGVAVAKIKRGRFFVINATPGRHTLNDEKGVPVSIEIQAGKKVFIRQDWRTGDSEGSLLPVWNTVAQDTARRDLLFLTYIDADKATSKAVPKTEPRESPRLMRRGEAE